VEKDYRMDRKAEIKEHAHIEITVTTIETIITRRKEVQSMRS
jgi:hypothetical protein